MLPYVARRIAAYLDSDGALYTVNVTTGGYSIALKEPQREYYYY